jgi:hypothetical protein
MAEALDDRLSRPPPGDVAAEQELDEEDDRDEAREVDRPAEDRAPEPGSAPVEHVLVAEVLVVGREQARPRDELAEEQVEQAAEGERRDRGDYDRPAEREARVLPEVEERGRRGDDRDERRRAT